MQRIRIDRRRVILLTVSVLLLALLIFIDRFSKVKFKEILESKTRIDVIKNFFYFTYTFNEGSAYGMLSGVSWAQTFFKILTPIALVAFLFLLYFGIKNDYKLLSIGTVLVIAGTVGNFIDRLMYSGVIDFICLEIGGNRWFGIFNVADVLLSFGMILLIIHFLFLDNSALFKKKAEEDPPKEQETDVN